MIDSIQSRTNHPAIIIIQADHGDRSTSYTRDPDPDGLRVPFAILNTYYWPDQNYNSLYETISPVNSFRVVLNNFFGTNMPLLPDESYYYRYPQKHLFFKAPPEASQTVTKTINNQ